MISDDTKSSLHDLLSTTYFAVVPGDKNDRPDMERGIGCNGCGLEDALEVGLLKRSNTGYVFMMIPLSPERVFALCALGRYLHDELEDENEVELNEVVSRQLEELLKEAHLP